MCVTNTPIAIDVIKKIIPYLESQKIVIDITTHNATGSIEMNNLFLTLEIR